MNNKTCFSAIVISLVLAVGCSNGNDKSDAYGNFETDEIIISSEANGKIMNIYFDEGVKVVENQLICLVDTTNLYLQKKQLVASNQAILTGLNKVHTSVEVLKSQRRIIEKDIQRLSLMLNDGATTQKQFDDATGQLDVVDMQIANANAQLASIIAEVGVVNAKIELLNDQIFRCQIMAPQDGVVLVKLSEAGEMTAAGKPLLKMANLDYLYLRAYVSGDMLPHIAIGQQVEVLIDMDQNSNQSLQGQISWISSSAEFTPKIIQTKKERVDQVYAIKIKVINDGRLKIGMPGEVVFNTDKQ